MHIRVDLGGWEHDCCGTSYEMNDIVTRDLYLPMGGDELPGGARYMESHHEQLSGGVSVTGRVASLEVGQAKGEFRQVMRLPSGSASRGFDDHDSGELVDLVTGTQIKGDGFEFIVVLDIPDGTELPTVKPRVVSSR